MKVTNELKQKVNYLNNQLKQSKMNNLVNKFVLGLSLLGVLSTVSCDNDHTTTPPKLKQVNLSANMNSKGIKDILKTGEAHVKLSITTDETGSSYASYYNTINEQTGVKLHDINFPIQKDGSIKTFLLKATESGQEYWVQKFNIYDKDPDGSGVNKGTLQYSLSNKKNFTLKTDSENNVEVKVVKNKQGDEETSTSLRAPSFSTQTVEGYSFQVGFLNSLKQWFGKSADYKINFVVKHVINSTTSEQYKNEDIFGNTTDAKTNLIQINMPRSKEYYEKGKFEVVAFVKRTDAGSKEHQFDTVGSDTEDTQIKAGGLILKINNNFPAIKVIGGDGTNLYSDNNKTFNLTTQSSDVTIFETSDQDSDPLTNTYTWALYKDKTEITTAYIGSNKISSYRNASIKPSDLKIDQETLSSKDDLDHYTLKVTAKADDGLGGITERTVEFNFKK